MKLTNDDYDVENIDLTFHQYSEKIEYVASFDITYRIRMFGAVLSLQSEDTQNLPDPTIQNFD